jgi:predicted ArsR family transcriptional regulator
MLRKQFLETSRGRIAALLRRGGLTVEEIAAQMRLTANAVRAQLSGMERDGLVRRAGQKRGTTRPAHVFELTDEVEQLLSGLYMPVLTHVISASAKSLRADQMKRIMRQSGKSLAADFPLSKRPGLSLDARVAAASELMNQQLGTVTRVVREDGRLMIRGAGCPLAAISGKHPYVCLIIESFVQELVGSPVRECCDRSGRPRCCFEIKSGR